MLCADWQHHSCCYLAWAVHPEWGRDAARVKRELRNVVKTIAGHEPVRLLVAADQVADARRQSFGVNVEIIEAQVDDIWMRDIAPTFLLRGSDLSAIDWNFNSWGRSPTRVPRPGDRLAETAAHTFNAVRVVAPFVAEGGAFVSDGNGTVITSKSCLLNKNRNPGVEADEIERWLSKIGVKSVIWLDGNPCEPITNGHVDGYVMFGEAGYVLIEGVGGVDRKADAIRLREIETLSAAVDASGMRLKIKVVEPPREKYWAFNNPEFSPSYLNAYVANGAVLAGRFGDEERDGKAQRALQAAFPNRKVKLMIIDNIASGGGGIRCLTQPVPTLYDIHSGRSGKPISA